MLETSYTELYDVAAKNGYFVKTPTGQPFNFSYIGARYGPSLHHILYLVLTVVAYS